MRWYVVAEENVDDAVAAVRNLIGETGEEIEAVKPLSTTIINRHKLEHGQVAHLYVRQINRSRLGKRP